MYLNVKTLKQVSDLDGSTPSRLTHSLIDLV